MSISSDYGSNINQAPALTLEPSTPSHIVRRILASVDPSEALLREVVALEAEPQLGTEVYEAVASRITIKHYWTYYKISEYYVNLQETKAAFFCALAAINMEPSYNNWHMYRACYNFYLGEERFGDAVAIAERQISLTPEIPIIDNAELQRVRSLAGIDLRQQDSRPGNTTVHAMFGPSELSLRIEGRFGSRTSASTSLALETFSLPVGRPEVNVLSLEDVNVIVFDGNVIVEDAAGEIEADLSVAEFPEAVRTKALAEHAASPFDCETCEILSVIIDKYSTANVCHNLLDHVTRFALYEKLEDVSETIAIVPQLSTEYLRVMLARVGVRHVRDARSRRMIKAKRILVSNTCNKAFSHPAHLGSGWAIEYLRSRFIPTGGVRKRRIYISRRDATVRQVQNEAEVEACLEQYGFETIILSEHPYQAQIDLFAGASHVVGMHGAGLTNIVFAPDGCQILEIFHGLGGTAAYAVISAEMNTKYSMLVASDAKRPTDPAYNDFKIGEMAFPNGVRETMNNRDVIVDVLELKRWLHSSGLSVNGAVAD